MTSGSVAEPATGTTAVSFVIPCLDEARTLAACIEKCLQAIHELDVPGEVVIADNGSTDGSQEIALSMGARVVAVGRRGYGAALISGCTAARGSYIVMGDADDSYDFRQAVPMVRKLQDGFDLCMGTRIKGKIDPGAMPWKNRHIGTPVLTNVLNAIYGSRFSDVNCGLRAFTKTAFERMHLESAGMEFASEMLVKSAVLRLRATELPITLHKDGRDRRPHLSPWRDGWRHLKFIALFAPKLMYWIPGLIMLVLGMTLGALLLSKPGGVPVHIGNFRFNDHWMIPCALLMVIGYETIITGFLVQIYTIVHRIYRRSPGVERLMKALTIERVLGFAALLLLAGFALEFSVVNAWVTGDFGPLNAFRPAVLGMALVLMGAQTIFSGFFYGVLIERYETDALTFE